MGLGFTISGFISKVAGVFGIMVPQSRKLKRCLHWMAQVW